MFTSFRKCEICHLHISHNAPYLPPQILHKLCFSFLLSITAVPREIENRAYAKFFLRGGGGKIRCIMGDVQVAYQAVSCESGSVVQQFQRNLQESKMLVQSFFANLHVNLLLLWCYYCSCCSRCSSSLLLHCKPVKTKHS